MSNIAVRVEGISKRYKIGAQRHERLKDLFAHGLSTLFHRRPSTDAFWALKDVSFEVKEGEVIGIIGRNGAGKSTLLKILSRITEPTKGRAEIYGSVRSLLEVGAGFDRELTGRENVYLNGAVLGMTKREIDRKFDEIVDFSGVAQFIDTPVKRYSSGMYVRLAFAVAAHMEPEILIVDEVLAVGDAEFQKKCLGKMGDVVKEGRTVLFVSHNMASILSLCKSAMLLTNGKIAMRGNSDEVVSAYLSAAAHAGGQHIWLDSTGAPGDDDIRIRAIRILNSKGTASETVRVDEDMYVEVEYQVFNYMHNVAVGFHLLSVDGTLILASTDADNSEGNTPREPGLYVSRCTIPRKFLNSSQYAVRLVGHVPGVRVLFPEEVILPFDVARTVDVGGHGRRPGVIRPLLTWKTIQVNKSDQL
jgi:lipopolysaccharide transport system ATP-binding protein